MKYKKYIFTINAKKYYSFIGLLDRYTNLHKGE